MVLWFPRCEAMGRRNVAMMGFELQIRGTLSKTAYDFRV